MPKAGSHKPEKAKFLDRAHVAALLDAPRAAGKWRDHYLLAATFYLCRRVGEVVLLQPRHFENIASGEIVIPLLKRLKVHRCRNSCARDCPDVGKRKWPRGYAKDQATGLPLKAVPIVGGKETLQAMLKWAGDRQWIFAGRAGKHLGVRRAEQIFNEWRDVAGLPPKATIHSLRHTGVSLVTAAGGIAVGRDIAGHASVATTDTYVHRQQRDVERAAKALDGTQ